MISRLREAWDFRAFIYVLAVRNLKVKYQQSALGLFWTLLNPALMVGILLVVFTRVARIPIEHYWAFLISGYFVWNFVSQSLTAATFVLSDHRTMIRSAVFSRDAPVLAAIMSRLAEFLIEFGLAILLIAIFHHGGLPASFWMLPVLIVVQILMVVGLSLPVAALGVFYYDVRHMLPIALTALFYATPIFYSLDLVPSGIRAFYLANPLVHLLDAFQAVAYEGVIPPSESLATLGFISLVTFLTGYAVFNRFRPIFAEVV